MAFKQIKQFPLFKKDLKKLLKRFRTLEDDLEIFIRTQLKLFHKIKKDNDGIKQITGLAKEYPLVFKAKKFACKSLKGKGAKSGIRIIYAYFEQEDTIEFIEIYFKGDKENEDKERIKKYFTSLHL
jgi:mRNA-degrading endonuclease YafQ of YafQ-DinJ toxin-antitoxin module